MTDTTAPTLTSLNLPATVYLKGANRAVTLSVGAEDVGDGVQAVQIWLSDTVSQIGSDELSWVSDTIYFDDAADSFSDGRSSLKWTLSSSTDAGTYSIVSVYVIDKAGNERTYEADELGARGWRTSFTVSEATAPDPPAPPPPGTVTTATTATLAEDMVNMMATGKANVDLTGNALDNVMVGNSGKNVLRGGAGNDRLNGGLGNDTLFGQEGRDAFVFKTKPNKKTNLDKIADFNVVDDSIHLDNAVFKKLGKGSESKPGKLSKAFFTVDNKAKDANDYVIYDKKKGVLLYDADGSEAGAAVQFATISKNLKFGAGDFFVI
jgi:Ca2+-binding RTX toxin-like protein